jgi:hypothetical protein
MAPSKIKGFVNLTVGFEEILDKGGILQPRRIVRPGADRDEGSSQEILGTITVETLLKAGTEFGRLKGTDIVLDVCTACGVADLE